MNDSGIGIAKVAKSSKHKATSNKFNLFGERTYEHSAKKRYETIYRPHSAVSETGPLQFTVPGK